METLPLARLTCNVTCGLLQKAKSQGGAGMWGEKPKVHQVPGQERTMYFRNISSLLEVQILPTDPSAKQREADHTH